MWKRERTNIRDVNISTPSLVFDAKTGIVHNYYYQRGAKKLKRRVAKADYIFSRPTEWPEPEVLAEGNEVRPHDAGNVNAVVYGDRHVLATYSGSPTNAAVFVVSVAADSIKEKDGYYVFDVAEAETRSEVLSGANGVMKLGAGMLTLSAENTFTGPLVISNGTIQVAQGKYLGSPSKVVIAKDGVLDVQETVNKYEVGGNDPIFPASTPVELAGKIVRNAGFVRNYTFKNVRLTDDAEVEAAGTSVTGLGGSVRITDAATGRELMAMAFDVASNGRSRLGEVAFDGQGLLVIDYELGGQSYRNHFLHGEPPFMLDNVKSWLRMGCYPLSGAKKEEM